MHLYPHSQGTTGSDTASDGSTAGGGKTASELLKSAFQAAAAAAGGHNNAQPMLKFDMPGQPGKR
jgi:hypothetical protein